MTIHFCFFLQSQEAGLGEDPVRRVVGRRLPEVLVLHPGADPEIPDSVRADSRFGIRRFTV
jgi:hypothetical protein